MSVVQSLPGSALDEALERAHVAAERNHVAVLLERIEGRLTSNLEEIFLDQGRAFHAAYMRDHQFAVHFAEAAPTTGSWIPAWEYATERSRGRFMRRLGEAIRAAMLVGADFVLGSIGFDSDLTFSLENPRAVRFLESHGAEMVRHIEETTRERVRAAVVEGVEQGASHEAIGRRIRALYAGFATPKPQQHIRDRAHLIAVTEMGNAYSFGNLETARNLAEAGLDMEKRWLTLEDDRVDAEFCLANEEAGWIDLEQIYPSGHISPLAHPACRCDQLYRLKRNTLREAVLILREGKVRQHERTSVLGKKFIVHEFQRKDRPKRAEQEMGKCYVNAGRFIMDYMQPGDVLVHGKPHLQVDAKDAQGNTVVAGSEFDHAWIERGNTVIDPSRDLKKPLEIPKELYYKLGKIDPAKNQLYDRAQAMERMLQSGHYGPWGQFTPEASGPPMTGVNIEEGIKYAVANNRGRKGSPKWNEEQIRSALVEAESALSLEPDTFVKTDHKPERVKMREQLVDQLYGKGSKAEGSMRPQAFVYMGPPGAGKSFMIKQDNQRMGIEPVLIDADEFKPLLPEWRNGLGADATHEESSFMKGMLLKKSMAGRDNISMPVVGKTYEGLFQQASELERRGYDVHVRLVDVSPQMSLNRTMTRFVETGRYIKPAYAYTSVDSKPLRNYVRLIQEPDLDFASHKAFDVNRGRAVEIHPEGENPRDSNLDPVTRVGFKGMRPEAELTQQDEPKSKRLPDNVLRHVPQPVRTPPE